MSTRREFLRTSAAAGGLLVALQLPGCAQRPEPAALGLPTAPVQPNAWLRIGTDGAITFLSDKSEMGQGVYTSLTTMIAEELDVPVESIRVEAAPAGAEYTNTLLGVQVTGGSTSVREGWDKLRRAGADARRRLVAAAAEHWDVDASELRTENGAVVRADGERLSYGQLATAAAALPASDAAVKPVSSFTQIGKPRTRLDTAAKINGTAAYGIDQRFPNMLFGALAQCPVLGGKVQTFDDARARAMPGVRNVVQASSGVVVLADSWWQAKNARDALDIEWDPGPAAGLSSATISAGLAAALETRAAEAKTARGDGDADAALAAAERKIEAVYELPMLAHATLEPQNCTVVPDGDTLHVYAPTQVQQSAQAAAAAAAGIAPERVVVHTTLLGGGFGRRLEVDFIPAAVEAARAANAPVKLLWTREDDTTHDYYRPPYRHRCSAALGADGSIAAWKLEICGPSVTSRWAPPVVEQMIDPFVLEAATNYPYDADNVLVKYLQHEIGIDVGYLRSVSHATNCFAAECFMDELANAAGEDPVEFRLARLSRQTEPRWRRVLERGAQRAGWGRAPAGRSQGVALMEGYGTYLALFAEIALENGKVRVHKISGAVDIGQMVNPSIVDAQIRGGIIFGLSQTLWGDITIENGVVQQRSFDGYRLLRIDEAPEIDVEIVANGEAPGGIGEPSTALVAPALYNAIHAATGRRLRSLPLARHGLA